MLPYNNDMIPQNVPPNQVELPYIVPRNIPEIQNERNRQIQQSLSFVQNRMVRGLASANPFKNYPLYPADMNKFCRNYPESLFYYRPIRYFFQRPVQMDYKNCFPHQKEVLKELMERDEKIRQSLEKKTVKYGIPKKMEDILKQGEIVHYPTATVISAADLKKKQEEYNKLMAKIEKLGPEGQRRIKKRNKEIRDIMRKIIYFNDFLLDCRSYTKSSKNLLDNKFVHIQATKANINEIKTFLLRVLKNIENFCRQFLGERINITATDKKKKEDSIFVIKSFVHQLFNDISSAFCNKTDVPEGVKILFRAYIKEKSVLPPFYLTTFEFNRLEFDVNLRLNQMTPDRQALMVGFLLLYRVLLIDIFKNYLTYFPKLRDMGNPIPDVLEQNIKRNAQMAQNRRGPVQSRLAGNEPIKTNDSNPQPFNPSTYNSNPLTSSSGANPTISSRRGNEQKNQGQTVNQQQANIVGQFSSKDADAKILYYKKRKQQIRDNLQYNFNFLIQVLHHIFKTAFEKNNPIYPDYFKNRHLYGKLVYSLEEETKRKLIEEENTDDIEIMHGIFKPTLECDAFLADNARWIHMYQLNTIQFCNEFARMVMED